MALRRFNQGGKKQNELTEEQMLGAVVFAHQEFQVAIDEIGDFGQKFGNDAWKWEAPSIDEALLSHWHCSGYSRGSCVLHR